jgi:hypothetical protein
MQVTGGYMMVFSVPYGTFFKRFHAVSKSTLLAFGHLKRVGQKISTYISEAISRRGKQKLFKQVIKTF